MTSNQTYRKTINPPEALQEIRLGSGTQFDPFFAEVFYWIMEGNKNQSNL